jgi:hypothetical protein
MTRDQTELYKSWEFLELKIQIMKTSLRHFNIITVYGLKIMKKEIKNKRGEKETKRKHITVMVCKGGPFA